ncbi:TonB-dependent receptor family protein [Spongiivirga citrea]|uniref:TonB-dependent receptor n=1 Tax=Spongiivirga citrea TaxID=1481457 RepID=A0A6M0CKT1_9FLAO|nr:TonB-dependent receptor [Spongiivirga citrea]NER16047.1 TonB-dependent receptor [Spongiivirga citrea]
MNKLFLPALFIICATASIYGQQNNQPQRKDSIYKLDEVVLSANVIFGSKFAAKNRTGSAYYISPEEIKKFGYTDINRTLRSVPGVNIYEEDGFGLRPNISLRGTSPERSSKITLMEDGVLIAPAPYSAPAAYYFPTIGRMQAVEILKGSSQIQYGPYTTGGAINMISTQIPNQFNAGLIASYGSFNTARIQAVVGESKTNFGYLVEYFNYNSDGFKELDNGGNTGFDKNDLVAKFRVNTAKEEGLNQSLDVKFQYSDEESDETYLGLTDDDFNATPFRRYAGSREDLMTTEHVQLQADYLLDFGTNFKITTTGYYNGFSRNWYKLNDVVANGDKVGIASVLEDPITFADHFAIVNGTQDAAADALYVKANNRKYISKGIQTKFDYHWTTETAFHDLEVGLRYHYDEEDRFQWVDQYGINNGLLNLTTAGIPGTDANRISSATAFASYITYKFKYKDLTLTPGIRYENIELQREDFGKNDVSRSGTDLSTRENKVDIFIPGIGINYNVNNSVSVFGGAHKGFSPPGSKDGEEAEESINYELGSRFKFAGISGELVAFYNDYSNLLGSDLAATGGTGNLEQFNAGEVLVSGLEFLINYNLLSGNDKLALPLTFGYTFTDTEFQNSFGSEEDLWGEVTAGDELPYISKHQFNAGISLESKKFEVNLSARLNGEFRTEAGRGSIPENELVPSNFTIDVSGKYHFNKHFSLTANIINALDETYAVSRVPAGLRPGHPFGVYGGIQLRY